MIKRHLVALFIFLLPLVAHAQGQSVIDSLKTVIQNAEHDSSLCSAYLRWGEHVYLSNPDTAVILFHQARETAEATLASGLPLAVEKKLLTSLADALNNIGYIYNYQGDIPKALEYYHKSLAIREEIRDKKGIANSLNNIGYIYDDQGDIAKALEYFHKSLKIDEEIGNKDGIATSLNNIGYIYGTQDHIEKALEYYHKSLIIREEIGYKEGIAISLNNIGYIYRNQGDIPKALEYIHKSLKIREEIGDKKGIAESLNNIGLIYKNHGDFPKGLEYYLKSLKIREEIGDKYGVANSLHNIGGIYLDQGDIQQAKTHATKMLDISMELDNPNLIRHAASRLLSIAKKQENYKEALEMYELHIQMRDSIKNEETQKATIRQQTKYEFEKAQLVKEQEVKEKARLEAEVTNRRDNLQYSVILIAILVLFGGVLSLGFVKVSSRMAEGVIFFSFLILFEFLLVLADPYIEGWSGGAPGIKLLFNAGIAALVFPLHSLFETKLKKRLAK